MGLKEDLQKLARDQCATYDRDGLCLLERGGCRTCLYFRDDVELPRCPYFENSVLPGVDTLHARYWNAFGSASDGKTCDRCGELFEAKRRQRYCADCKKEAERESRRRRNQRYYAANK